MSAPLPPAPEPEAVAPEPLIRFTVRESWAREAVRLSYWPLTRWRGCVGPVCGSRHWVVTDEEAAALGPKMQPFLQAVFDRYIPETLSAFLGKAEERHPELFTLVLAMAALTWKKWRYVRKLMAEEATVRASAGESREEEAAGGGRPEGETVTCEICGLRFPDRREALLHLPCPGRAN